MHLNLAQDKRKLKFEREAQQWLSMCSAIKLSSGAGLQPFSAPSGWMSEMNRVPQQVFTQDEFKEELDRCKPVLLELVNACWERAPTLCKMPTASLVLARLAAWTSDSWVRSIEEWPGEPLAQERIIAELADMDYDENKAAIDRAVRMGQGEDMKNWFVSQQTAEKIQIDKKKKEPPAPKVWEPPKDVVSYSELLKGKEQRLSEVCGQWEWMVSQRKSIGITIEKTGRVVYDGQWNGAQYDFVYEREDSVGRFWLDRRDGWTLDFDRSTEKKLIWVHPRHPATTWLRTVQEDLTAMFEKEKKRFSGSYESAWSSTPSMPSKELTEVHIPGIRSRATQLRNMGRPDDAEPLFKQVLEIARRVYGQARPDEMIEHLNDYSEILRALGRDADAEPLEKEESDLRQQEKIKQEARMQLEDGYLRSLVAHLIEKWEVPPALHSALNYIDGTMPSEAAHRISMAFLSVHTAAGRGDSNVLTGLKSHVSPAAGKKTAKMFSKLTNESLGGCRSSPLHGFRRAQVDSEGGQKWVADGVCESLLGDAILPTDGEGPTEGFASDVINWVCLNQEKLEGAYQATSLINFFFEMKALQHNYTMVGRSPTNIGKAFEAYVASTVNFDDDDGYEERFQPNPRGIKGMLELKATIPNGTIVDAPFLYYEKKNNVLGGEGRPGGKEAAIRISEILSFRRLRYEGEQLDNCLESGLRSQIKYLSRVRNRESSFWSLTKQEEGGPVEHLCLIEVWHLRHGNDIRQAEGPRPRTIPSAEAWYWLDKWCKQENIDLSTWDCYS